MKIKYAIVSSNNNKNYLDFWPIVKKLWVDLIGIKPILVLISDKDLVTDYGDSIIHEIKYIDGYDSGFLSQISRMYVTKYYNDDVCIISDIDMLPLSKTYFNDYLNEVPDNDIAILSSDAYNYLRFPICYNAGNGQIFNDILDLECDFSEYAKRLKGFNWGWDTDELYFAMKVNEYNEKNRIHLFKRGWVSGIANDRIDRIRWSYDENKLKNGGYIDSHSLRPYNEFKPHIDNLVNTVLHGFHNGE